MAAAAVPWIIKGGMALGTYFAGKKAANAAKKLTPSETLYGTQAAGQAGQMGRMGQMLGDQGLGYAKQGGGYFSKVLGGNRAQMQEMVAPEARAVTDLYSGAGKQIERSGMVGPTRDVASAELARTQAGKLSDLYMGARPRAAGELLNLGTTMTGQGVGAAQGAGGLFSTLRGQETGTRLAGQQIANQTGTDVGRMIFDIMTSSGGNKGKKGAQGSAGGDAFAGFRGTPTATPAATGVFQNVRF